MTLQEAIEARHSVRKYVDKLIPQDIIAILQAKIEHTDITEEPLIASQFLVYSGPTVLLMLDRKEVYRGFGFINLDELEHKIMQYSDFLSNL